MTFEASRRKQVLVLQPRGKALYEDESSFGSKMLAKMGWNKGSGLGKEQHGSLDFIQIRYKNNANGLGYDGLKDNQWTENESQFDNLLKKLNGTEAPGNSGSADEQTTTPKSKSLEEQSKSSRARVHYKKFTRGKDVHKYSEKDLANILGKKTLIEVVKEPEVEEEVVDDKPDVYDSNLIVKAGLSVTDYFKQKMEAKRLGVLQTSDEISDNGMLKKKNKKMQLIEEIQEMTENVDEVVELEISKPSKKKRGLKQDEEQQLPEISEETEQPEPPKKKKKKSKTELVEENPEVEVETVENVPEEPAQKSKKKKSRKLAGETVEVAQAEEDTTSAIETKKSKKKSKKDRKEYSTELVQPAEVPQASEKTLPAAGEPENLSGANAVYSTNIIQIPSHVAQKMSCMVIENFKNSNVSNVVGYGLTEEIEIKTVQTKVGENFNSTDKYSLYNMDKLTTRQKTNPRKILSKLKRTKKVIQVI